MAKQLMIRVLKDENVLEFHGAMAEFHGALPEEFHGGQTAEFHGAITGEFHGGLTAEFHGAMVNGEFHGRLELPPGQTAELTFRHAEPAHRVRVKRDKQGNLFLTLG